MTTKAPQMWKDVLFYLFETVSNFTSSGIIDLSNVRMFVFLYFFITLSNAYPLVVCFPWDVFISSGEIQGKE